MSILRYNWSMIFLAILEDFLPKVFNYQCNNFMFILMLVNKGEFSRLEWFQVKRLADLSLVEIIAVIYTEIFLL